MEKIVFIGSLGLDGLHLGLIGAAVLLIGGLVWFRTRVNTDRIGLDHKLEALEELAADAVVQRERAETAERDLAAAHAHNEKSQEQFAHLAQSVLQKSQQQFMTLANETFAKHKEGAKGDLTALMKPIGESFQKFNERVEAIEKVRAEDRSAIGEQIKAMTEDLARNRHATSKLVTALSAPKGGGRWGEMTLKNVMEHAGLSQHCDFVEQAQATTEDGASLRPDVIIRLPANREIVVDAKVSLEDYLKAVNEADPDLRLTLLKRHARKVKDHITRLGSKAYQDTLNERIDFVAMFIPGENFYAAALEQIPDLMDYAAGKKIIVTTPSTLMGLAKAVAYGWRQEEATENAREAAELGRTLYQRLLTMGNHLEKLGKSLNGAVDNYNRLTASVETRVLPGARKFQELAIAPPDKTVPPVERIEKRASLPERTGELDFDEEVA